MTRLLLPLFAVACALPATASAASLSLTTPPDSTYSSARATVTTTVSGTTDTPPMGGSGQHVSILLDGTTKSCAATVAAEQQQSDPDNRYGGPTYFGPMPGAPFSQQLTIDVTNATSPSDWKLCGYITGPNADSSPPAASAGTGTFTLTNPKALTGADRAGFSFIVPHPRAAKPTMTLHPGDLLWLGGSFAYGVNQFACAGPDNRLYWFSDAFEGANHRSHGAPAVLGKTDDMSGLELKWTLSKHLKPGKYAIQLACADGSLATGKRVLTVKSTKTKKRRHKRG